MFRCSWNRKFYFCVMEYFNYQILLCWTSQDPNQLHQWPKFEQTFGCKSTINWRSSILTCQKVKLHFSGNGKYFQLNSLFSMIFHFEQQLLFCAALHQNLQNFLSRMTMTYCKQSLTLDCLLFCFEFYQQGKLQKRKTVISEIFYQVVNMQYVHTCCRKNNVITMKIYNNKTSKYRKIHNKKLLLKGIKFD